MEAMPGDRSPAQRESFIPGSFSGSDEGDERRPPWLHRHEACGSCAPHGLYRYCRHLTRSPWDAEDLAQDTLARAFVTLGTMGHAPPSPRAWLFRVASNLWIDQARRRRLEPRVEAASIDAPDPGRAPREAARARCWSRSRRRSARRGRAQGRVRSHARRRSPRRLSTTDGRGQGRAPPRARQARSSPRRRKRAPRPKARPGAGRADAFCAAANAGDIHDRLTGLLLGTAAVEVVGATTQCGPRRRGAPSSTGCSSAARGWRRPT